MAKQTDLSAIQDAIATSGYDWEAESNFMSNLSPDQRKIYLGFTPGPDDPSFEEMEAISANALASFMTQNNFSDAITAPAAFDWRSHNGQNYVTPVKNQGSCGSCVAFGTIAALESVIKITRGASYAIDLSEAQLFYCIARSQGRTCGGNSGGWWPEPAMIGCRDIGIVDESCYPYVAGDQNCTNRCSDWANRVTKISGYTKVNGINAIKEWVSTKGPVSACYTVYSDFYNYKNGIYKRTSNKVEGGHCVTIVGYNDTLKYWICKNSWGTGFGMSGYFNIAYGECGIESQIYGINSIVNNYTITNKKVVALYVTKHTRNAWAYIQSNGWLKISNNNDSGCLNLLTQLSSAKITGSNVTIVLKNGMIEKVYVF